MSIINATISNVSVNYGLGIYNSVINLYDTKIYNNIIQGSLMLFGNHNVANFNDVYIMSNELHRNEEAIDGGIIKLGNSSKLNIIGKTHITNNTLQTSYISESGHMAAIHISDALSIINIGDEEIVVRDNNEIGDQNEFNHLYGIYSYNSTGFINALDYTTFNKNNYIENIAFNETDKKGIIQKNYNGELYKVQEHYVADTKYDKKLGAYQFESDAIIGIRKIEFDLNVPKNYVVVGSVSTIYPGVATRTIATIARCRRPRLPRVKKPCFKI